MNTLILITTFCTGLFAPGDKSHRTYLNNVLEPTNRGNATYYKEPAGQDGSLYTGKIFTMDHLLKADGHYADPELKMAQGHFTYYFPNGKVESEGDYAKGQKTGIWQRYNEWGEQLAEKVYNPDVLENLIYAQAPTMPQYPGGQQAMIRYIKEKVGDAKGATATFVVEKDGTLSDIKVIGLEGEKAEQLAAALKTVPPLSAGEKDGAPIRVHMSVPIK